MICWIIESSGRRVLPRARPTAEQLKLKPNDGLSMHSQCCQARKHSSSLFCLPELCCSLHRRHPMSNLADTGKGQGCHLLLTPWDIFGSEAIPVHCAWDGAHQQLLALGLVRCCSVCTVGSVHLWRITGMQSIWGRCRGWIRLLAILKNAVKCQAGIPLAVGDSLPGTHLIPSRRHWDIRSSPASGPRRWPVVWCWPIHAALLETFLTPASPNLRDIHCPQRAQQGAAEGGRSRH